MHIKLLYLALLSSVLLTSCLSALHPLSNNQEDFIFKPKLIGKWGDPKNTSDYVIVDTAQGTGGKLYKITCIQNVDSGVIEKTGMFGNLIKLKNIYYLDIWPDER